MSGRIAIILCMVFLLCAGKTDAQNRFLRKGNRAFAEQEYQDALRYYKKIRKKDVMVEAKIAGCYYFLKKYDLAERQYARIESEELGAEDLVRYSQVRLSQGDYADALRLMELAGKAGADPVFVKNRLNGIRWAMTARPSDEVKVVETGIRITGKSFGVQILEDGLVFSREVRKKRKKKYHQLFHAKATGTSFEAPKPFGKNLDPKSNLGGLAFSGDGKTLYYTKGIVERDGRQWMRIFEAQLEGKEWTKGRELSINGRGFSCAYPALSPDEQALYFSSDRPGGNGGMDLYVSYRSGKEWSKPVSLGEKVNTSGDEVYPWMAGEGKLYFASDGHVGLGGLDIFSSLRNQSDEWEAPKNLGAPVNSSLNDYSYILNLEDKGQVYFVSDRLDRGAHDRIFRVEKVEKEIVTIVVKDELTGAPLADAEVKVVRIADGCEIGRLKRGNARGEYLFQIVRADAQKGIRFQVSANRDQYHPREEEFRPDPNKLSLHLALEPLQKEPEYRFEVELQPVLYPNRKLIFRNIYYKSNSYSLTTESCAVLDRLSQFLKAFPELRLKLNAHTDSRGDALLNERLSQKRAEATKQYLVKKGFSGDRIEVRGFGERYILNGCVDGVACAEADHEYNRRLEVIIVL